MLLLASFLLFSAIIFLTPLKYYLPGYNIDGNRKDILQLRKTTDSLIVKDKQREAYIVNLMNVVQGNVQITKDTAILSAATIASLQKKEEASIKSANAIRRTLPPPAKIDSIKKVKDSMQVKNNE